MSFSAPRFHTRLGRAFLEASETLRSTVSNWVTCGRDRRGKLIALTPKGRDLVDHAVEAHLENEERLLASLPAAKRRELAALLRELLSSLDPRSDGGDSRGTSGI